MGEEAVLQSKILKDLKKEGIWHFKVISANRKGVPDIVGFTKTKFFAIEVKARNGRLSPLQKIELDLIAANGGFVCVAYNFQDYLKFKSFLS